MNQDEKKDNSIEEYGQMTLENENGRRMIHLLSIIGEVEGHENAPGTSKTTKYDHVLPMLAALEEDKRVEGMLVLLNTSGGDVDAGLAIAEMIASLSIPTVSLVLGGSHSIGVPLSVAADYTVIAPSATVIIHPVRMSGMVLGAPQTYEYFRLIQERITGFIAAHSNVSEDTIEQWMITPGILSRDLGTILVGRQAVEAGLYQCVGGIHEALQELQQRIAKNRTDICS